MKHVLLLFASIALAIPAANPDAQEHTWRWYSRGGLEIEVRDDWHVPKDSPWMFRSTPRSGEIAFDRWQPIRSSQYFDFDDWVARQLVDVKGMHEVSAVTPRTVGGLKALTYTSRDPSQPTMPAMHETWIGVPDPPGGVVFSFWTTTTAQGRDLDELMRVYDRMLATMRLHPLALATHTAGKWSGPLPEGAHTNPYRASVFNVAAWVERDLGGDRPVIEVDPRILVTLTGGRGLPSAGEALHAPASLVGVSLDNMVIIMSLDRARQCTGTGARTCRTDGRFVAVTFDTAAVKGDTATVTALVRVSRAPTAEDLARAQRSANPTVALGRYGTEAGSATLMRLTLARRNTLWSVVSRTIIGQT